MKYWATTQKINNSSYKNKEEVIMGVITLCVVIVIGILTIIGCRMAFSDGSHPDKRDVGVIILAVIICFLIIAVSILEIGYSPIRSPKFMEKGLIATTIEQPDNTFFIKTSEGLIFLIRPSKKNKPIPNIGNKVVFVGDDYEIIYDE